MRNPFSFYPVKALPSSKGRSHSAGEISRQLAKEPITLKDGCVEISDTPGLGIEVDEKMIEKYRVE
ncbi:MAG: hypothetical protein M3Y82_06470 [Verrucomicrobiota bacterium]|nr:hypothetical protein [Verrucomicrobiota bacterium]